MKPRRPENMSLPPPLHPGASTTEAPPSTCTGSVMQQAVTAPVVSCNWPKVHTIHQSLRGKSIHQSLEVVKHTMVVMVDDRDDENPLVKIQSG